MKLIDETFKSGYVQSYAGVPKIEGVKVLELRNFVGDEGDFCELFRLNEKGFVEALLPDLEFLPRQVNRSKVFPKSVKAWHYHFYQNELWYVPPSQQLFVGLWDLREESPSKNIKMRLNLGGGSSRMLYIPKGVAHGCANFSAQNVDLFYICSEQFNLEKLDENRISWDFDQNSKEFWTPERD